MHKEHVLKPSRITRWSSARTREPAITLVVSYYTPGHSLYGYDVQPIMENGLRCTALYLFWEGLRPDPAPDAADRH